MGFPLQRDFDQGEISGLNGGWISIIQTALIYDEISRPEPTSGYYYFEIANEYSGKYCSQFEFNKLFLQGKGFGSCLGKRTVVVSRLGVGNIFGSNPILNFKINGVQMAVLTL
jgi:hypothetical protein